MNTSYATDSASRTEGRLAKSIEKQTAKLPSDTFLWAAIGSMGVSAALQAAGNKHASLFVGQWAPAFLLLGSTTSWSSSWVRTSTIRRSVGAAP